MHRFLKTLAVVLAAFALAPTVLAQVIADTFPGTTLNSSYWNADSGTLGGSFVVNNGLTLNSRAHLTTVDTFAPNPLLTIEGAVSFSNGEDFLSIALRFGGAYSGEFQESTNGLRVALAPVNDTVLIYNVGAASVLGSTAYDFTTGTSYDFKVTDDGSTVSVFVGGSLLLSATTATDNGDYVGFYNREGINGLSFSSLSVSAVPEPSTYAAIFGACALGLAAWRRRTKARA